MATLKVINLFGGPGAGKSKVRARLFAKFKDRRIKVEETTEYAKDLTWEGHENLLADQLLILANQNRKLERLRGKVEWVVTDSPLLLGINYRLPKYLPKHFEGLVWELWNTYDNYNFFLEREGEYDPTGRKQTLEEAKQIDRNIQLLLSRASMDSVIIPGTKKAAKLILKHLKVPK